MTITKITAKYYDVLQDAWKVRAFDVEPGFLVDGREFKPGTEPFNALFAAALDLVRKTLANEFDADHQDLVNKADITMTDDPENDYEMMATMETLRKARNEYISRRLNDDFKSIWDNVTGGIDERGMTRVDRYVMGCEIIDVQ